MLGAPLCLQPPCSRKQCCLCLRALCSPHWGTYAPLTSSSSSVPKVASASLPSCPSELGCFSRLNQGAKHRVRICPGQQQQLPSNPAAACLSRSIPQCYREHGEVTAWPSALPDSHAITVLPRQEQTNTLLVLLCACPGRWWGAAKELGLAGRGDPACLTIPSGTKTSCQFQLGSSVTGRNASLQSHSTGIIVRDF